MSKQHKIKINISIDDISPHPLSSTKVLLRCAQLIDSFPDIKFTLFIPIAYWRTKNRANVKTASREPYNIWEDHQFVKEIRNLNENNFEIGFHGYFHGIPGVSNNDEFKSLTYEECLSKIDLMLEGVQKAGLTDKFKKIFRPPAWKMSPGCFRAFKDRGFTLLALSKQPQMLEIYQGEDKHFEKVNYYNLNPPFIQLKQLSEDLNIVYHACEWDKNYLDEKRVEELTSFLKSIGNKEFVFMR